jgi:phosphate-selective porin OprO/OprP
MQPFVRLIALSSLATATIIVASPIAAAGEAPVLDDKMPVASWNACDLLDMVTLHENQDTPALQKFTLSGRMQADAAFFESDQGDLDTLNWRRVRNGFKSTHFDDFVVHAEADFDLEDSDPLYRRLTEANVKWSNSEAFEVKIGKQGANFTLDGSISSTKLIRMERSLLSTNLWFTERFFSGASVAGEVDGWVYYAGVFSSDSGTEFGDFEAGEFGVISLGYDLAESLALDRASVRVDYVHNSPSGKGTLGTRSLSDVVSLNATFEQGQWGLSGDLAAAKGWGTQSDLAGVSAMPYYTINDRWQLVASYNLVSSEDANGVRLDRYESRIESGRSDEAHEFYFGVNHYLCGHQVKWQAGIEYTSAEDSANDGGAYDGWGVSSGIRISW